MSILTSTVMLHHTTTSLAISISCLAIIAALSVPALYQYLERVRVRKDQYSELSDLYEDEDGTATEESQEAYSDFLPRLILLLTSAIASTDALISAVLTSTRSHPSLSVEQWLQFATWLCIVLQAVTIFTTHASVKRYDLGICSGISSLLLFLAVAFENISLWQSNINPHPRNVHLTLSLIQLAAGIILTFASLLIPRRPDVYWNGHVVDRQHTTSFLNKISFTWPGTILTTAVNNRGLNYDDLAEVGHEARSRELRREFEAVEKQDKLWKTLFWARKGIFLQQWGLQAMTSFTQFLPQIALYAILKTLERRDAGDDVVLRSWLLVIGLGAANIFSTWLEARAFFVIFLKLGVPIYEQLSAVIFGKAIRRKDVKGAGKKKEGETPAENGEVLLNSEVVVDADVGPKGESGVSEEEAEEDFQKSRQSTINLVGVDSKRIADFASFNDIFLGSAIKMIFACGFLLKLIGPIPLLAGLVPSVVVTPLNMITAKRYAAAQDDLMKYRDQKMAVVTEALQGIRQIKFSALERNWYDKILRSRKRELDTQWQVFKYDTILISIWIFGPVTLSAISLAVYALIHNELSASVAFTTISVFEQIEMTLAVIPEMVTDLLDAIISANRIQDYLDAPERTEYVRPGETISFKNTTIAWPADDMEQEEAHFRLKSLNIDFPKNELSVVSGRTGSGKSLLLASIIGEAEVLDGVLTIPKAPLAEDRYDSAANKGNWCIESSIAFVAQIPWIENATIRDNILFGLPLDNTRYQKVLKACALTKDLEMLEDGELTDIGANGINLSGGQKWRVSFARALYSRAGILILDDIFSAVDAHVGRQLFEEALTGELGKGRTRILVTHHVALCLPRTKYSVLLSEGTVEVAGKTEELRKSGQLKLILAQDIEELQKQDEGEAEKDNALTVDDGGGLQKILTNQSRRSRRSTTGEFDRNLSRRRSHANLDDQKTRDPPKKFTEEEQRATGAIKYNIYKSYIKACGGYTYWLFILMIFSSWVGVFLGRSYWISLWTRSYRTESVFHNRLVQQSLGAFLNVQSRLKATEIDPNLRYYLGVYVAISLCAWVIGTIRYYFVFLGSIQASKMLFENLSFAILRAPLRWLDTVPLGRILNRFTADFNMLDSRISMDLGFMLHNFMFVLSIIIAGLLVSGFMIFFVLALILICAYYASHYLAGAREVKRLESNAKSPVFEQFGSVLMGIGTIRAFDKSQAYLDRMYKKIDTHCRAYWHLWLFNRWMGWRLNMLGALFVTITAALIVSITSIDSSLAGFALSFALGMSEGVIWFLRQYSNVELDMNATERIVEYSNIAIEDQGGHDAPAAWPTEGKLEVEDLVVGYAPDLPPVLKGLTFSVARNQRIGVVGRTGAGKSSLTLSLFRFLEARSGSILIDGVDISKIKLYDLRSRLAIIPQDPVLFSGTVRSNLDAFDQHTDSELREALTRVHLVSSTTTSSVHASGNATPTMNGDDTVPQHTNTNVFKSLSSRISEGGLNLSQGQRQLLCLARAIVSRPKIMVLDEATSAVDMETDALIQRSIREEFTDSTLIVIAHRLSTIADFDRILVLGEGKVVEFDTPSELMKRQNGVFRDMVEKSGERSELEKIIHGTEGGEGSTG